MARLPSVILVPGGVEVPAAEVSLSYARSGGPGGQHVNRTSTKVLLRWNPGTSRALSEPQRQLLQQRLGHRLTKEGDLLLASERYRDQARNVVDAVERFRALLERALRPPRPRKKTRPTRASAERRLAGKRRRSQQKRERRGGGGE
jgi:ribosome-associated protein